jgi:hypothetical protein
MITNLENRIRKLEVDVTVKEWIKLEKEEVRIIIEKVKELEKKKESDTSLSKVKQRKIILQVGVVIVRKIQIYKIIKTERSLSFRYLQYER